ncbi:TPA: sulfatase-like hydrolase/transferase [Enterococcus faecalis]|nr:sulfatase-like hydrolase/transferase [Enterococcus faecalis]HAP4416525.1 sulfatase-like hydrolase/transferase [Enterococcus faecalis]
MKKRVEKFRRWPYRYLLYGIGFILLIIFSNLYLQWCQNNLSVDLSFKFAFSWHTEKFFLGCFVLSVFLLFLCSLAGSLGVGALLYSVIIGVLGFADYQKMFYRVEPIYPDDLKMITEVSLLKEMVGLWPFVFVVALGCVALFFLGKAFYKSFFLSKKKQTIRVLSLVLSIGLFSYIGDFNNPQNLLRKAYNKTALWIPYSQKMNYYNTGFIGGFLYNLKVEAMDQPKGYSKEAISEITQKYQKLAETKTVPSNEQPNIVFVMSESFSNPDHLKGLSIIGNPLADYQQIADKTYSGQMLSQNYGGGTANIEFEALTSFSMELMNAQMTTPYTMMIPKMTELPSIVSLLKEQKYQTTAIHPYNTSMYKRKDVYKILGFDQFINEKTMNYTDKLENNPYISDQAAYQEVTTLLKEKEQPQFIHLVTMQTHMPYENKYTTSNYFSQGNGNQVALNNYLQDIAYSSEALKNFLQEIEKMPKRTLVVFWGDHLPSIYDENIQALNEGAALHQTEFLMYDTANQLTEKNQHQATISPFYFAPSLFQQSGLPQSGFYAMLNEVQEQLPAFEKGNYYLGGEWKKTVEMNKKQEQLYEEYRLIQYDIVSGKQYSLENQFFS